MKWNIYTEVIPLMPARQRLFSIALTIPDTAALLEAVDMLEESEHKVQTLWSNVEYPPFLFRRCIHP
eukprot:COSAG05_NODE_612_length_8357_cov_40.832647_4_plen_67_part_00